MPIAFLAGLALTPRLWLSAGREYPLVPVVGSPGIVPAPFDVIWLGALGLALAAVAVSRTTRMPLFVALGLALGLALLDQSRWQPWAYQYVLMLAALAVAPAGGRASGARPAPFGHPSLAICALIVASIYVWSGLSKVGAAFVHEVYPDLLDPIVGGPLPGPVAAAAYLVPVFETAIGVGLLTVRGRPFAIVGAILMHGFILLSLGPLGSNQNNVVWPWNLAMVAFVPILFWRARGSLADLFASARAWSPAAQAAALAAAVLVGVLPALSFVGRWDSYLSAALYSGSNLRGTVFTTGAVAARLPPGAQRALEPGPDGPALRLYEWSMSELNVPPYPARRVLEAVAAPLCQAAGRAGVQPGLVLVIIERPDRLTGRSELTRVPCSALQV